MHKKRSEVPKEWPIPRKGDKYVKVATHNLDKGIPILVILRDILKLVRTRKEAKKICNEGKIKINGIIRKEIGFPLCNRDILQIEDLNKTFVVEIQNEKFVVKEKEGLKDIKKILKVIGKNILKGKRIQANLEDGTNILTKEKFSVGDSFLVSFPEKKVLKVIHLTKGTKVEIISGKYSGLKGEIIAEDEDRNNFFKVKLEDGREVDLTKKSLLAIE
ncbi:MAG: S4 domain-containing protein [Candidatus Pacearchaeota archaeon]